MTKNLIPTINISSLVNKDFNSNKSIKWYKDEYDLNEIIKLIKSV